jgi:hypothetical protein
MLEKELEKRTSQIRHENTTQLEQEKIRLAKHYDEKEKQLEDAYAVNTKLLDEEINQAIAANEAKHTQKDKESKLQYSRIVSINKELVTKVQKLEKALENVPPELRGTAGELVLQDELEKEFKFDEFKPKEVGVEMADLIQTIVTETGHRLHTPIAYDKKMGDNVTKLDLEKAKRYKVIHNTDHVIIVTAKGFKINRFTEKREGILLVHPIVLIDVARMFRSLIIETERFAKRSEEFESKQTEIYNYVTSLEYNREWELKLDIKSQLNELQSSDDRRHKQISDKRRKLIDRLYELIEKNHTTISDILHDDDKRNDNT